MNLKLKNIQPITCAEIDLRAIEYNFREICRLAARNRFSLPTRPGIKLDAIPPSQVLTVVKADAYGHGMEKVALLLNKLGVGQFAVSDVKEGIFLRSLKIKKPILLLESTLPYFDKDIIEYNLTPTICTLELAKNLNERARKKRIIVDVHIKVDTGMGRLGVWHKEAFDFIHIIHKLKNLRIVGIYTHFAAADSDHDFTLGQIDALYYLVTRLDRSGLIIPFVHAANSMGLAGYKTHVLNLVRPGLMIYGLHPDDKLKSQISLKPALSIKSKIIFLKNIQKGRTISYGRTFMATRAMKVATIPIGYNDGYMRALSNKSSVLIDGVSCRVLGRVTMDQIVVDVTNVKSPKLGQEVVVLGLQKGKEISADQLAKEADTINYEIVCNLGNRLKRVYI